MKKENLKKIFFALFLMLFVPAVQAGESSIDTNSEANKGETAGSDNASYTNNPGSEKKKSFRERVKEKGKKLANSARAVRDKTKNAYRDKMEVRRRSKEAARETAKNVKAEQKNRNGTGSKV